MPIAPGTQLGQYEIASFLGGAGLGEVYQAYEARGVEIRGKEVALLVGVAPDR